MVERATTPENKRRELKKVNLNALTYSADIIRAFKSEQETEREYRFRVARFPREGFKCNRKQVIRQGYFNGTFTNEEDISKTHTMRLREAWNSEQGSRYKLIYKTEVEPGDKIHRIEHGGKIMDAWFPELWKQTGQNHLTKVRFYDENAKRDFQIHLDVYVDPPELRGLVVVEFEFKDDAARERFDRTQYPWLGEDLTNTHGWGNSALATAGLPSNANLPDQPTPVLQSLFTQAKEEYEKYSTR